MGERLSEEEVNGKQGWGHKVRYRLAAGFVQPGDTVVDAACGIGYGRYILNKTPITYLGIDKLPVEDRLGDAYAYSEDDLLEWQAPFNFDIGISFETIEHLENYTNLLTQLKKAKKWVICSVPVVPTVHLNEYHLHDFQPLEFPSIFEDEDWELYQYLGQPQELSEIYVFKRRSYNG